MPNTHRLDQQKKDYASYALGLYMVDKHLKNSPWALNAFCCQSQPFKFGMPSVKATRGAATE